MYDMYPWDSDSQGDYPPEPLRSWRDPNPRETSPVTSPAQAVQTALDRRDNGGDAAGTHAASTHAASTHAASTHAASTHAAGTRATPPTTSVTRQ